MKTTSLKYTLILFIAILLSACGQGGNSSSTGTTNTTTSIPSTTKILNQSSMAALKSVTGQNSLLVFSQKTTQLASIQIGDVLVLAPSPLTPDGLLRKVQSIRENNGQIEITTQQAFLNEAIENGEISFNAELRASDIEREESLHEGIAPINSATTPRVQNGKSAKTVQSKISFSFKDTILSSLELQGNLDMQVKAVFNAKVEWFKMTQMTTYIQAVESAQLRAYIHKTAGIDKEKRIKTIYFRRFVVWVGTLPVYIRPVMQIFIGAKATSSLESTTEVTQALNYKAGLQYQNSSWKVINTLTKTFGFDGPSLEANLNAKAYIKSRMLFFIYGVSAPYVTPEGYLTLDADINQNPWCHLYAGIGGAAGIAGKILSYNLGKVEKQLFDVKTKLYECKTPIMMVKGVNDLKFAFAEGAASGQGSYQVLAKDNTLQWAVSSNQSWLDLSLPGGVVDPYNSNLLTINLNNNANSLKEGTYIAKLKFTNTTSGQGNTVRNVVVSVRKPSMTVTPEPDTFLLDSQVEGGNFTAKWVDFVLRSDIGSIDFQASSNANWVTVAPQTGTITPTIPVTVRVLLDPAKASLLGATTHKAQIAFVNTTNGLGDTTRSVFVQPTMNVSAGDVVWSISEGSNIKKTAQWQINAINDNIQWQAQASSAWLNIPVEQGSIAKAGSTQVAVNLAASAAQNLPVGTYQGQVTFTNLNSGALIDRSIRNITLHVKEAFVVSPAQAGFSMPPGGAASPASTAIQIQSEQGAVVSVSNSASWLDISANTFNLSAGVPQSLTLSVNSQAQSLPEGSYQATLTFSTQGSGRVVQKTVLVTLNVTQTANKPDGTYILNCTRQNYFYEPNVANVGLGLDGGATITLTTTGTIPVGANFTTGGNFTITGLPISPITGTASYLAQLIGNQEVITYASGSATLNTGGVPAGAVTVNTISVDWNWQMNRQPALYLRWTAIEQVGALGVWKCTGQ